MSESLPPKFNWESSSELLNFDLHFKNMFNAFPTHKYVSVNNDKTSSIKRKFDADVK